MRPHLHQGSPGASPEQQGLLNSPHLSRNWSAKFDCAQSSLELGDGEGGKRSTVCSHQRSRWWTGQREKWELQLGHFSRVQLCEPMHCSLPGSSLHGILHARILEWVAIPSSRGSSQSSDRIWVSYVSCIGTWVLYFK